MKNKKLYRSKNDRMLTGVCGGIAEYFGIDSTIVRLAYVVLSVFSAAFPGLLVYVIMAIIVPEGSNDGSKEVDYEFTDDGNNGNGGNNGDNYGSQQ